MPFPRPLLLTNDDGIDAPGLEALARAVEGGVIVAPRDQHSICSHKVTLDRPLCIDERAPGRYAVGGTPADCARLASAVLELRPALVISGINQGANLGHDTYLSGTVAAAREAAVLGMRAISISQYRKGAVEVDWRWAERTAARVLQIVFDRPWPGMGFWNINLPHPGDAGDAPEIVDCPRCLAPLPTEYARENGGYRYVGGRYHTRQRTPGSDVDICFGGRISVTWMPL